MKLGLSLKAYQPLLISQHSAPLVINSFFSRVSLTVSSAKPGRQPCYS